MSHGGQNSGKPSRLSPAFPEWVNLRRGALLAAVEKVAAALRLR